MIVQNFPNIRKEIVNQVQEAQSPRQDELRHTVIKLTTTTKNAKRRRGEITNSIQGTPIKLELNTPTKIHRLAGWMKACPCMHFHLLQHST